MRIKWLRKVVVKALSFVDLRSKHDIFERYAKFMDVSSTKDQLSIFKIIQEYYPSTTRFVVMPMDMSHMGAGAIPQKIDAQHEELAQLAKTMDKAVIPFAAIDPRRNNLDKALDDLFIKKKYSGINFTGIKLYPPLGYKPGGKKLDPLFAFANEHKLPITAHCSRGGVRQLNFTKKKAHDYTNPANYRKVLDKYPDMRLCLAHCGGDEEWKKYLEHPRSKDNWPSDIRGMMQEYDNLYADISYSIFSFTDNTPILKVLLQDKAIKERVLFGSDFYMAEKERYEEKRLSITLRAMLGEDLFWQIANVNPKRFLFGIQ